MKDDPIRTAYERWLIDNGRMPTAIGWEYFRSGWHLREALATRSTEPGEVGLRADGKLTREELAEMLGEPEPMADEERLRFTRKYVEELKAAHAALSQPAENAELVALREALEKCRERFAEYEQNHLRKICAPDRGDIGNSAERRNQAAQEKADRNREMVELIDAALSAPGGEAK